MATKQPSPSQVTGALFAKTRRTNPGDTQVYMVGGGIASLVAAVHLTHDAEVPAENIHILEASGKPGGAMSSVNNAEHGYDVRGTRKLNFTYHCLYDTLAIVPTGTDGRTILQEIKSFNKYFNNPKHTNPIRLVAASEEGPKIVDASRLRLEQVDKVKLLDLLLNEEEEVGDKEIQHCFSPKFTESLFWDLWCTMYGFQPWHSAQEFRRYLHRFLHEFPHLQNMGGVDRTPMNDFESVIVPLEKHLASSGVDFQYGMTVTCLEFDEEIDDICVTKLRTSTSDKHEGCIQIAQQDIVLLTLGSMVSGCKSGSNTEAPPPMPHQSEVTQQPGPVWKFWANLADPERTRHSRAFGNPKNFYSHIANSSWISFTTTLKNTDLMERLGELSGGLRESYPLITFRDSPWLMSITIPVQPYFLQQSRETLVLWGYGLFPDQDGKYVKKPMTRCTGQEIFTELLGHLAFPPEKLLKRSITIPVLMPFIGSSYLTRKEGDRPKVVPDGSINLGLMGQFVEIERDVTFTMEYSARSAQTAVFKLMGLSKRPREVHRGDHSVQVLGEVLKAIMD